MDYGNNFNAMNTPQYNGNMQTAQPMQYTGVQPQPYTYQQSMSAQTNAAQAQQFQRPDVSPLLSHPGQFWHRNNNSHCLFVSDNLSSPSEKDYCNNGGDELLMQVHSKYSRFQITIFEYASKQYANYNLDPAKLAGIDKKMEALHVMQMMNKSSKDKEPLSAAYTTMLTGKFKDTPANLLLAAQETGNLQQVINDLAAQVTFLTQNVAKYPKNQLQINAIRDAFNLLNAGQLVKKNSGTDKIPILEDMKVPFARKVDAQGYTSVVSCNITCNFANSYPISIEVMNGSAIPVIKENGLTNANMSTLKDLRKYSYNLSLEDFDDLLENMSEQKRTFERDIRAKRRKIAKDFEFKQKEVQKLQKQQVQQ